MPVGNGKNPVNISIYKDNEGFGKEDIYKVTLNKKPLIKKPLYLKILIFV